MQFFVNLFELIKIMVCFIAFSLVVGGGVWLIAFLGLNIVLIAAPVAVMFLFVHLARQHYKQRTWESE